MKTNISIIIPCYRSGAYLERTVAGIKAALAAEKDIRSQIILVNDASPDDTFEAVRRLCAGDRRIVGVDLAENVGQANARLAGLPYVRGRVLIFMDDDGQHPAEGIGPLVRRCGEGAHLVYAQFPILRETAFRRFAGSVHNLMLTVFLGKPPGLRITSFFAVDAAGIALLRSGLPISPTGGESVSGQRAEGASALRASLPSGRRRPVKTGPFIGALFFGRTRKIATVSMDHRSREDGKSNYNLRKLFRFWYSMMVAPHLPGRAGMPAWKVRELLNPPPEY